MSRVAVMGPAAQIAGFALAGAVLVPAEPAEAVAAWDALDPDIAVVVLAPGVRDALGDRAHDGRRLAVTLPA